MSELTGSHAPGPRLHERKLWMGFALIAILVAVVGFLGAGTLRETISDKDQIIYEHSDVVLELERLKSATQLAERSARSYLLTGNNNEFLAYEAAQREVAAKVATLLHERIHTERARQMFKSVFAGEKEYRASVDEAVRLRQVGTDLQAVSSYYERAVQPHRARLDVGLDQLVQAELAELEQAKQHSQAQAARTYHLLVAVAAAATLLSVALLLWLLRVFRELRRGRVTLELALDAMERKNRDLDAFAGRIAHDLRNLLAPLPTVAMALKRSPEASSQRSGERIQRVVERSTTMMSALLAFSRAGQPVDAEGSANVAHVVRDVLEDVRPQIEAVRAEVVLDVQELSLRCSEGLLGTIVANLVGNALKFLEGRNERRVVISSNANGRWCEISIADTGPGIGAADRARIFEPFYRVPGTRAPGTGVGLATVQRIVEAHGGRVALESELDVGSKFVVWLPLALDPLRSGTEHVPASVQPVLRH